MADLELIRIEKEYLVNSSKSPGNGIASSSSKTNAQGPHWDDFPALSSRAGKIQNLTQGSNQGVISQRGKEGKGENEASRTREGGSSSGYYRVNIKPTDPGTTSRTSAPCQDSGNVELNGLSQGKAKSGEGGQNDNPKDAPQQATSEHETQFETMRRRNPTWAQVMEQNTKKLDPFARFAGIQFVDSFEKEEVEEILDGLISNALPVDNFDEVKEEDIVDVNLQFLVSTTRHLQTTSILIYTMELKVSYRYVQQWAEATFRQALGVNITSICLLSRNCFHVCFDSEVSRHVFANAPYYMGDPMVYVLPWDPRFNPNGLRTRAIPIWVELLDVPPNCASYGLAMEEKFTSFEEAERSLARPASKIDQDDLVRLSCVGGNRLAFAEGQKKFRNGTELELSQESPPISPRAEDLQSRKQGVSKQVSERPVNSSGSKPRNGQATSS
ncbi:hypothetical protein R1sor_008925 [Riccia sorocarpa]|uniref:DUF4283 domain-containing protein n=1 Tax=Riccia sorocarpa TaxID=122646 RepID=A0ABD3H8B2_9MARC